ncbi:SOS response-associated peptidase [Streptomyces sp. AJS327]|uniref:SOS response-associated peptidase n=1 Tax=Streptomyces sp. AJS327 TaxID=2545265 RepID=UPI0015DE4039|nr:SOS response-associated peptidase [Streptomyces sp. AJS327]MBA0051498.1 SOS response-associated peptidase [Streptomyces sp. AJS327]
MCGRYAASRSPEDLAGLFEVEKWDPAETLVPDWNVAPTKQVYAVLDRPVRGSDDPRPVRQLRPLRWGLVPGWAKSPEMAVKMINARAETVHEKPAYRAPFAKRRCLLPADGYYEWQEPTASTVPGEDPGRGGGTVPTPGQRGGKKRTPKQPYFVTPGNGSVLAMAGLYEFWRDRTLPDGHPQAWWATCTVITTEAETGPLAPEPDGDTGEDGPGTLAEIHPRMPLTLTPDRWGAWLDPALGDGPELRELLAPPPGGLMRAYPVGRAVSSVRNNGPELLEKEHAREPEESTLF